MQFQHDLISWFAAEKRDLPWRRTADPYQIWISEIMLQQTRVDTVIPYYKRFIEKFPTLNDLAEADEQILLKQWEGLGYYSRARNLQAGVKEVAENYGGIVPDNRKEISSLKGVGPYTAGAVLSIAYGVPEHAVDGNVMRVLSRILLIEEDIAKPKTRKIFEEAVTEIISHEDPSSFNQGLMELGALICTPTSPKCLLCPVREHCAAFHEGRQHDLPIKTKAKKTKSLQYAMIAIRSNDKLLMEQRPATGLLANMWQFPMLETAADVLPLEIEEQLSENLKGIVDKAEKITSFKHVFSHLTWNVDGFIADSENIVAPEHMRWVTAEEMDLLPIAGPVQKMKTALQQRGDV
ncbi:A/G-specific adenine glycosylase [Planomicrobium stackebrandtii]|uniref:Adenine DNA glycosylase n=1 Tax=Planomicrobium stackebrandtii TaxID=253160 RepID=A0ABU0GYX9_9BACL|nr:A/G-specific adenine glycosylase [Planomicrobium stackebrandtii]MDQ0430561.1 A/G-specific adenine glycosylase [Planomicrobium stackebrandtii]